MTSFVEFLGASRIARGSAIVACALQILACGAMLRAAEYPPEARRKSPPSGIKARAGKVGAEFPRLELAATTGTVGFAKGVRHIVVFYRGSW